jgi:hypothetical protein
VATRSYTLSAFGSIPKVALYCVAREHIQEGIRVRVLESLNKRTISAVCIGPLEEIWEESNNKGEKGCKGLYVNIADI